MGSMMCYRLVLSRIILRNIYRINTFLRQKLTHSKKVLVPDAFLTILISYRSLLTIIFDRFTRANNSIRNAICKAAGINLFMTIKILPNYRDYWSAKSKIRDLIISSSISRTRFGWLLGNLHINDNNLQPLHGHLEFGKLYKLRPLLDKLADLQTAVNQNKINL